MRARTQGVGEAVPAGIYLVIGMMVCVFALQVLWDPQAKVLGRCILSRASVAGILGHMWLHNGLVHLVVNLVFVWVVGRVLCLRMAASVFLASYVLAGVVGGLAHLAYDGRTMTGASGAIAGLLGMYAILCFDRMGRAGPWLIVTWFALNAGHAVLDRSGPAYAAHCAGFVAGMLTAAALVRLGKSAQPACPPPQVAAAPGV